MDYAHLGFALLLVLANGFFVATELALVKVRPSRLQALAEEHRPGASRVLKMLSRLDACLAVTQFGVTLSSLGLGWIGEPAFAHLTQPVVEAFMPAGVAAMQLTHSLALA